MIPTPYNRQIHRLHVWAPSCPCRAPREASRHPLFLWHLPVWLPAFLLGHIKNGTQNDGAQAADRWCIGRPHSICFNVHLPSEGSSKSRFTATTGVTVGGSPDMPVVSCSSFATLAVFPRIAFRMQQSIGPAALPGSVSQQRHPNADASRPPLPPQTPLLCLLGFQTSQ